MINLGTALDDVLLRIKKPLFQQIFIATIAMLYFYLYFIQKLYYYFFLKGRLYDQLNQTRRSVLFVVCSVGTVIVVHISILNLLLAQRNQGTVFLHGYFKGDFWFFAIPLITYVIFLCYKPNALLLLLPKIRDDITIKEQELVIFKITM